jgi:hypothetical protein
MLHNAQGEGDLHSQNARSDWGTISHQAMQGPSTPYFGNPPTPYAMGFNPKFQSLGLCIRI